MKLLHLLCSLSLFHTVSTLNIVFYVLLLGKSHIDFTDSLIDSLVEKGHTVDLIIARMNSLVKTNGTSKVDRFYSYGYESNCPWSKQPHLTNPFKPSGRTFNDHRIIMQIVADVCGKGLSDPGLHQFLSSRKYDVGIATDYDYCGFSLFNYYKIPSIASVNAMAATELQTMAAGLPNSAAVSQVLMHVEDTSTFFGRFWNLLRWTHVNYIRYPECDRMQTDVIQKYLGSSISPREAVQNIDVVFLNTNEIIDLPRPMSYKMKYIGGVNMKKPNKLDDEMDKLMSKSSEGVVLFCFGTQVPPSAFPVEIRKSFVEAFSHFPDYTFIWKYALQEGDEEIFKNATNLYLMNWLPQTDILYDSRTKGFISHTGLNSYVEASHAGVPILAIPLFIDQPYNAMSGESVGTTYILDKSKITTESIIAGLNAILHNPTYSQNSKRISKMLAEQPHFPKSEFVKWIEFIGSNPLLHRHLNQPSINMSPIHYYCIDIIFFIIFTFLTSIFVIFKILRAVIYSSIKVLEPFKQKHAKTL